MDRTARLVNSPWPELFARLSLRALFTIAHYQELTVSHGPRKGAFAHWLGTAFRELPWPDRLDRLLNLHDRALLEQLGRGEPPTGVGLEIRFPEQLHSPWPPLVALAPLEKLMALGCVVPVRHPAAVEFLVPAPIAHALVGRPRFPAPVATGLPPAPRLGDLLDDAVTILAMLQVDPARHSGAARWPAAVLAALRRACPAPHLTPKEQCTRLHILHQLLHQAGWLATTDAQCVPSAQAPVFLEQAPAAQLRALLQPATAGVLLPALLPADLDPRCLQGPALLDWLFARLAALGPGTYPLPPLLVAWDQQQGPVLSPPVFVPPPGSDPPGAALGHDLLTRLLCGPLRLLGLVETAESHLALTGEGRAWLAAAAAPVPADPGPRLEHLAVAVPRLAAPTLRYQLTPWAAHRVDGAGRHLYHFTPATLARGQALYGSARPLLQLLRRHFPILPAPLQQHLRRHCRPPALRIRRALVLRADDPATLTRLLAQRRLRDHLGARLGPHTVEVYQERLLRRLLARQGLLAPAAAPPAPGGAAAAEDGFHLVLALRLAGRAAPAYAAAFARLAARHLAHLSVEQRARLDEIWGLLETPDPDEEPVRPGEEPRSPLAEAHLRALLAAAIEEGLLVRVRYYTYGRQVIGWRAIRPVALHGPYLDAYCHRRGEERTFRLDRILALEPAGSTERGGAPPSPPPPRPADQPPAVRLAPDFGDDLT